MEARTGDESSERTALEEEATDFISRTYGWSIDMDWAEKQAYQYNTKAGTLSPPLISKGILNAQQIAKSSGIGHPDERNSHIPSLLLAISRAEKPVPFKERQLTMETKLQILETAEMSDAKNAVSQAKLDLNKAVLLHEHTALVFLNQAEAELSQALLHHERASALQELRL